MPGSFAILERTSEEEKGVDICTSFPVYVSKVADDLQSEIDRRKTNATVSASLAKFSKSSSFT